MLAEPIAVDGVEIVADKGLVGRAFKKEASLVFAHLESMDFEAAAALEESLKSGPVTFALEGKDFVFEPAMLKKVERKTKMIHGETVISGCLQRPGIINGPAFQRIVCAWLLVLVSRTSLPAPSCLLLQQVFRDASNRVRHVPSAWWGIRAQVCAGRHRAVIWCWSHHLCRAGAQLWR